ncbi:hypothetical protein N7491_010944 [Penicillium cf. griseofulvum]|uniref:Peptidase A1 domain-containing protein n=1 Tax=Penicillium cf. griseofulvum TaxID=2972120 RepID=A0A9W9N0S1_9EURO|nr:hypothetical protein N7472_001263 [Penicillium cf. griseofulvum]KAJ5422499.1 hypothetical protein N7491_010944 [Penicillium cf. griseofulvum]
MRLITALWVWSNWASASAHTFPVRDVPAVIGMDLYGYKISKPQLKRDTATLATNVLNETGYFINISIGTPPQPMGMLVDLLTPEIYVMSEDTHNAKSKCQENRYCSSFGSYNISESSSNSTKEIPSQYKWASPYTVPTDILTIGGTQVKDVGLSLTKVSFDNWNSIGLSPDNQSFPYQLVDQDLIRSPSFSIWGNTSESGGAGIIFGGINKAKYHGPLQAFGFNITTGVVSLPLSRFQVQTDSNVPTNYTISSPKPYTLSAQYITTTLPRDIVLRMYKDYNISFVGWEGQDPQFGLLPCSRQTENHTVSLIFGDATISAPWSDLFRPWDSKYGERCSFLIQPEDENENATFSGRIGTSFSDHMYMAINYNNAFVGVAALNGNPGPDDIVEIGDGPEIPDAVGDFPTSIVPYTKPKPTVSTSTSTGLASMPTYMSGGMFVGVAGAALVAAF